MAFPFPFLAAQERPFPFFLAFLEEAFPFPFLAAQERPFPFLRNDVPVPAEKSAKFQFKTFFIIKNVPIVADEH